MIMSYFADGFEVNNVIFGVADTFDVDGLGLVVNCCCEGRRLIGGDEFDTDAEFFERDWLMD